MYMCVRHRGFVWRSGYPPSVSHVAGTSLQVSSEMKTPRVRQALTHGSLRSQLQRSSSRPRSLCWRILKGSAPPQRTFQPSESQDEDSSVVCESVDPNPHEASSRKLLDSYLLHCGNMMITLCAPSHLCSFSTLL